MPAVSRKPVSRGPHDERESFTELVRGVVSVCRLAKILDLESCGKLPG